MRCLIKHLWMYWTDKDGRKWRECAKCGVIR